MVILSRLARSIIIILAAIVREHRPSQVCV